MAISVCPTQLHADPVSNFCEVLFLSALPPASLRLCCGGPEMKCGGALQLRAQADWAG